MTRDPRPGPVVTPALDGPPAPPRVIQALVTLALAAALAACSGAAPNPTAPNATTPANSPVQTSAAPPSPRPSPSPSPSPAESAAAAAESMSIAAMRSAFQASFAAYPWRWKQTVVQKDSKLTLESVLEAQSGTRVHLTGPLPPAEHAVLEAILISPALYLKATGVPASWATYLTQVGAKEGEWFKVPKNSPLAGFAEMVYLVGNPAKLLETIGFTKELDALAAAGQKYDLVGSEAVGTTPTTVYALSVGSGATAVNYRVSVGADGRIYKMVSDGPLQTATTIVEYDSTIRVDSPVP